MRQECILFAWQMLFKYFPHDNSFQPQPLLTRLIDDFPKIPIRVMFEVDNIDNVTENYVLMRMRDYVVKFEFQQFRNYIKHYCRKIAADRFEFVFYFHDKAISEFVCMMSDSSNLNVTVVTPPFEWARAFSENANVITAYPYGTVSSSDKKAVLNRIKQVKSAKKVRIYLDADEVLIDWDVSVVSQETKLVERFVNWLVDELNPALSESFDEVEYVILTARTPQSESTNPQHLKIAAVCALLAERGINIDESKRFFVGGMGYTKGDFIRAYQKCHSTSYAFAFDDMSENIRAEAGAGSCAAAIKVYSNFELPSDAEAELMLVLERANRPVYSPDLFGAKGVHDSISSDSSADATSSLVDSRATTVGDEDEDDYVRVFGR